MNLLMEIFGLDPSEYKQREFQWAFEEAGVFFPLMVFLVPLALWFFWTSLSRIKSPVTKSFLFILRAAAFALIVFLLLKPELEFKKKNVLTNTIAVLMDDSKSMSIKTFPDEIPRIDFVKTTLDKNRKFFEALEKSFKVDLYFFSDRVDPVPFSEVLNQYEPKSLNTDFGSSLSQLKERMEGKPLQGVMMFTDGADLTEGTEEVSKDLLNLLVDLKSPVHTFQAGSNDRFKDLAIGNLEAADFGFVYQPVRLSVNVDASSMGNKNVSLVLREGENILVTKILELKERISRYKADLEFVPRKKGKRIYTLTLPLFSGESIATNNRRDFQIKIIRDRTRVLHLNGRPSWDSRFLREVLANNPKVDLLSFFILRTLGDDVVSPTSELSLIPFPTNLLFSDYLNSFDLIIFQNFRYDPFIDLRYLSNIKNFVEAGGAFLMIGGDLSFQQGGYERTPIEEVLPVRLQKRSPSFMDVEFKLEMEKQILHHPILRLEKDDDMNREIWQGLPAMNGVNAGLIPESGAHVLAGYRKDSSMIPVLVAGSMGKGRAVALATDSSWNWNFRRVGEGGSGRYYQKFWNNIIAWLTGDTETQLIQLETDKERYQEGDGALIKFKVLKDDYNPDPGRNVTLILQSAAGESREIPLQTDKNGEGSYEFIPAQEGFYKARIRVERGKEKTCRELSFGVFSETAEFDKPLVKDSLLKKIAEVTGGQYQVLNAGTNLNGYLFENPEVFEKTKTRVISLWDNWWAYGFIVGLLFIDWWVRRRSGLS
ncbi:MAG: glutamine amidotransferase [Nitrospinota bacterium]|nr:glutamine amidotransferase [Nitrospinota bacterium]